MTADSRLDRARRILGGHGLDGLIVRRPAASRWLSGFTLRPGDESTSGWSGTALLTPELKLLLADARYT
ncbi:MAG TPA: aminopeptidase P family N-terminal domain-containing protein, partial [Candidatus Limnocylindrales bacterium]|nr:aminopeptidase P family N-terminal domain-containing protein [Candidatus Limnocylindrales bacterium]